jgi:hypothetical protein
MRAAVESTAPLLPEDKPRYLMASGCRSISSTRWSRASICSTA